MSDLWGHGRRWVYPRPRGGAIAGSSYNTNMNGLSPPARGSPSPSGPPLFDPGSIPARAGEPRSRSRQKSTSRVYPRPRGGASAAPIFWISCIGLSPPARGSHLVVFAVPVGHRSIPARAGEPARGATCPRLRRVYPRPRGGAWSKATATSPDKGLSPPARGSRWLANAGTFNRGSIPARAGEPLARERGHIQSGVYPRPRGGALWRWAARGRAEGLSPPARGSRSLSTVLGPGPRSIPARAGEPSDAFMVAPSFAVYPRPRGEPFRGVGGHMLPEVYPRPRGGAPPPVPSSRPEQVYPRPRGGAVLLDLFPDRVDGLSPPARGSLRPVSCRQPRHRSIPARAGEPPPGEAAPGDRAVYPRPRGGAKKFANIPLEDMGLSPPARGSRGGLRRCVLCLGSIPARAGEPPNLRRYAPMATVYPARAGEPCPRPGASRCTQVYPRPRGGAG